MNIRSKRYLLGLSLIIVITLGCQRNKSTDAGQEQSYSIIDPRSLIVHKDDLAVRIALRRDSLYSKIERSLIDNEGMTEEEAIQQVQFMINNKLIEEPVISYYDEEGRQVKKLEYVEFKRVIEIVKDSVDKQ